MSERALDALVGFTSLLGGAAILTISNLAIPEDGNLPLAALAPMLYGIARLAPVIISSSIKLSELVTSARAGNRLHPTPRQRTPIARRVTSLAAWIAGPARDMKNAWLAHLAGDLDSGIRLTRWQRTKASTGFLRAALMYRLTDLCAPLIWVLRKDSRVNGLIALIVGAQALYITGCGGFPAFVTDVPEPCAITAGALYLFLRWLRGPLQVDVITAQQRAQANPPRD
ncbi:hypothetical protein OG729_25120 [Streptomyces sp. NBC_00210]|uniref:hypothetical protein n=1 Tax=unclassified Streptomyces TaxID=2593676 RepID=UPI00324D401E